MSDTIIWITGATDGIGAELARQVPYAGARIINLSRRKHPDYESVIFDLTEPSSWDKVRRHVEAELAKFKGERALFVQNATWMAGYGVVENVSAEIYRKALFGFVTAPLALGEMFVRACRPGFESGLVMMSAGAAVACLEGCSAYGAGKIAIEHWAQIVDKELGRAPGKPWVVAVRPGGVLSAGVRKLVESTDDSTPNVAHVRANAHRRLTPERAAAEIWKALPPPPGVSLITLAPLPDYAGIAFEGERMKEVQVPGWQLVYR
jgi:benzil reductase ((S)-benzoin forming)